MTSMKIDRIQISNFRNIVDANLEFHPNVNWIVGANGSGKTSLLEAIYCLGSARSFRTSNYNQLVNFETSVMNLFAQISDEREVVIKLGVQIADKRKRIRVNNEDVKTASTLAEHLAIQVITPNQSKLIEEGPRLRRKFIDWGMFHVEHSFKSDWRRLLQSLKQRNAQLKLAHKYQDVAHWDLDFLDVSKKICLAREMYVGQLLETITSFTRQLDNFIQIEFELYNGWPKDKNLSDCIQNHFLLDRKKGLTQHGPHKADLRIKSEHTLFKDVASRGQIKLLSTILKIAQLEHLRDRVQQDGILMIDDLASEFDLENQRRVFNWAKATGAQLFITCTNEDTVHNIDPCGESKMFHVEHGTFIF